MPISLDSQPLELKCPTCKRPIKKTVGWFKRQGQKCPHGCGTTFDTADFHKGIRDCERELEKFQRELGRITFRL